MIRAVLLIRRHPHRALESASLQGLVGDLRSLVGEGSLEPGWQAPRRDARGIGTYRDSYNRRWRRGGGHTHDRLSGKCATKCSVRLVSSSVLGLALVLCACGQGQPTPTAQGVTTTPPDIAGPPSTTRFVPPMEQINRSDTSSALGRVCWVIFEVQEHLAGLLGTALSSPEGRDPPDEAKAVDVWRRLKRLLASVPEALGADADLPADARRFRESLLKASKDALAYVERQPERQSIERRAQSHQALAGLLHLAELPGAQEFQLLAVPNSVACPHLAG